MRPIHLTLSHPIPKEDPMTETVTKFEPGSTAKQLREVLSMCDMVMVDA